MNRVAKLLRSIPARAGKPRWPSRWPPCGQVYPRAGGETALCCRVPIMARGLSPRGRGNREHRNHAHRVQRSIPARAGKPPAISALQSLSQVYPRAGGETLLNVQHRRDRPGLSPRGRGNPVRRFLAADIQGSIPARAGKPPAASVSNDSLKVYPRAGGETPSRPLVLLNMAGLSPRGRGNLCVILTHSYAYVKDRWIALLLGRYGRSPAMCRIRFHTSLASGSAR